MQSAGYIYNKMGINLESAKRINTIFKIKAKLFYLEFVK